jgi:TM2 domain-containing membrane protein YozV
MNCNYHPEVPSSAFCQFCGKPLCKDCVRNVGGSVFCEACLTERLRGSGGGAAAPVFTGTPHPMLAALLGFIPGVGAMYNGQYAKAIAHVLIFAVLASLSDHTSGVFGALCAAWVFYQVFDAYQTAVARRDGHPLPNPFGLNDIAQRLGIHPTPGMPGVPPMPPAPPIGGTGWEPVAGPAQQGQQQSGQPQPGQPQPGQTQSGPYAGFVPPAGAAYTGQPYTGQPYTGQAYTGQAGYTPAPGQQPYPPMPPIPPMPPAFGGRDIPTGAIILIGLGILFLFGSLGLLHEDWVAHGWPLLIIGLGIWIIFRRTQSVPPAFPPYDPSSIHSPGHTHAAPAQTGPTDTTGGTR